MSKSIRNRKSRNIESLNGARFIAIMIIVVSHFEFLKVFDNYGDIYWNFFHNPTLGVDFFFLLSGFGMMLSSLRKDPEGREPVGGLRGGLIFAKKHVQKIYPIYIAFLILGIPYMFLEYLDEGKSLFNAFMKLALGSPLDLMLLQAATGKSAFSHSFNGVCWFLSCLFCVYLVSPIMMKVLKRHIQTNRQAFIGFGVCILASCILAGIFEWIEINTFFDDLVYGSPYRRVFYVASGMIIAQIYLFNKDNICVRHEMFEYLSIGGAAVWFLLRNFTIEYMGVLIYSIDIVVIGCVLYFLALENGVASRFLSNKYMRYLGSISMYIFLSHYNIRMYIDYVIRKYVISSFAIGIIEAIIIVVITLVVSSLIHRCRMMSHPYKN